MVCWKQRNSLITSTCQKLRACIIPTSCYLFFLQNTMSNTISKPVMVGSQRTIFLWWKMIYGHLYLCYHMFAQMTNHFLYGLPKAAINLILGSKGSLGMKCHEIDGICRIICIVNLFAIWFHMSYNMSKYQKQSLNDIRVKLISHSVQELKTAANMLQWLCQRMLGEIQFHKESMFVHCRDDTLLLSDIRLKGWNGRVNCARQMAM